MILGTSGGLSLGDSVTTTPTTTLDIRDSLEPYMTFSSGTTVLIDQLIGSYGFFSRDVTANSSGGLGGIRLYSETAFNTAKTPSYLSFYTHSNSNNDDTVLGNVTEQMRINSSGVIKIYNSLQSDVINELSIDVGITAESVLLKDGRAFNFDSTAPTTDPELANKLYVDTVASGASKWDTVTGGINYSGGNVGIKDITPIHSLDVYADSNNDFIASFVQDNIGGYGVEIDVDSTSNGDPALWVKNGATTLLWVGCGGHIGLNDTLPTYLLDVNGDAHFVDQVDFDTFPVGPSSAPTTDYQFANKKYVDDNAAGIGFGSQYQIPYTNVGLDGFDYSSRLTYDGSAIHIRDAGVSFHKLTGIRYELKVATIGSVIFEPQITDGASAISFYYNTQTNLSTAGAKLLSISNASTEKFYIDKDGNTETQGGLILNSTSNALLVPRMTTTQKNALTAVNGMILYDTTLNAFYFYENGSWVTK